MAGRDDWRLPNIRELQSLVDFGRFDPSIDPILEAVSNSCYGSSSTSVWEPFGHECCSRAWVVCFHHGIDVNDLLKSLGTRHIRAVRTIQPGE